MEEVGNEVDCGNNYLPCSGTKRQAGYGSPLPDS